MLVGMVDVIFADVAQPDQARIVAINAHNFLKTNGHVVISIKANCIDSTAPAEHVFALCNPSHGLNAKRVKRKYSCSRGAFPESSSHPADCKKKKERCRRVQQEIVCVKAGCILLKYRRIQHE